jgi:hypothetical protein
MKANAAKSFEIAAAESNPPATDQCSVREKHFRRLDDLLQVEISQEHGPVAGAERDDPTRYELANIHSGGAISLRRIDGAQQTMQYQPRDETLNIQSRAL